MVQAPLICIELMEKNNRIDELRLQSVLYELRFFPDCATGIDEKNSILIAETVCRLPIEVQERIIDEVVFVGIDGVYGQFKIFGLNSGYKDGLIPMILVNFSSMRRKSKKFKLTVIAHEIAHFFLQHEDSIGGKEIEIEADDLCEKWGFGRSYDNYDMFK